LLFVKKKLGFRGGAGPFAVEAEQIRKDAGIDRFPSGDGGLLGRDQFGRIECRSLAALLSGLGRAFDRDFAGAKGFVRVGPGGVPVAGGVGCLVRGEDSAIEAQVGETEPRGAFVVEVCESAGAKSWSLGASVRAGFCHDC
jgi:hypothetical protein